MKRKNIKDIDMNNAYFHFTEKGNLKSIAQNGLKAQIGDASKLVDDKSRVCFSQGVKGILGIKNSFIWEFEHAKICDIPEGYKKYFDIKDFSSTDLIPKEIVYEALKRKFENEVYLVVDAKEGEDFLPEEINGLGSNFDVKGKEGHDISPKKISKLVIPNANNAWETIQYVYNNLIEKNPDIEGIIRMMNSNLDEMITYFRNKELEVPQNEDFTLKQRVARFLRKNNLFMNLEFVENFVHSQLDVFAIKKSKIPEEKVDSRKDFMEFISNNGEFRKEEFSHLSDSKSTAIEEIDKIIEQMNASRDENKDDERI